MSETPREKEAQQDNRDADGPVDFEGALAELEELVAKMEGGSLSLEESLAAFERGIKLTRECQAALRSAELRIKALTQEGDELELSATDEQDVR
ncbi:MAG: exodeoxyribonuclease VII small subunit [Gammaproteobacteria bacterium]|nr:exodeoxyribonuclease VII small subunit [Gammaproteobacteria bacterium]MDE0444852.1 exodeoxyribonuclease VII small subunit [Gammaproteobacteria bacterium]